MNLFRLINADQPTDGGKDINGGGWCLFDAATFDTIRPVDNTRGANPPFKQLTFAAAKITISFVAIATVIRGIDDDRIIEGTDLFQFFD